MTDSTWQMSRGLWMLLTPWWPCWCRIFPLQFLKWCLPSPFWPKLLKLHFCIGVSCFSSANGRPTGHPSSDSRMAQPFILGRLLSYFKPASPMSLEDGLWACTHLLVLQVVTLAFYHTNQFNIFHWGMKVRVSCCTILYRKVTPCIYFYLKTSM